VFVACVPDIETSGILSASADGISKGNGIENGVSNLNNTTHQSATKVIFGSLCSTSARITAIARMRIAAVILI
jgi:hypothetical protein